MSAVFTGPYSNSHLTNKEVISGLPQQVINHLNDTYGPSACQDSERDYFMRLSKSDIGRLFARIEYIPPELSHCLGIYPANDIRNSDYFLLKTKTGVVGRIDCRRIENVRNPTCFLTATPNGGEYTIWIVSFPLRNIHDFALNFDHITMAAIAKLPIATPFSAEQFERHGGVEFSASASAKILSLEQELSYIRSNSKE